MDSNQRLGTIGSGVPSPAKVATLIFPFLIIPTLCVVLCLLCKCILHVSVARCVKLLPLPYPYAMETRRLSNGTCDSPKCCTIFIPLFLFVSFTFPRPMLTRVCAYVIFFIFSKSINCFVKHISMDISTYIHTHTHICIYKTYRKSLYFSVPPSRT